MNNYYKAIFILTLIIFQSCKKSTEKSTIAKVEIIDKEFNFGSISMSDSASFIFKIKNISKVPFKISKVGTSCGCTTTEYTRDSIYLNEVATIELLFKPNQIGNIEKSIVVEGNSDPPYNVFYIRGGVIE
ncbi:MAG: DUF1573 domain-containing protein [Algicola sp.]|nr:DUF1573 domain-containing protein [Algicola sp.]